MNAVEPRTELFADLRELSAMVPDLRVGQLLAALGEVCADLHGRGLWEASNEELAEASWQFRQGLEKPNGSSAPLHAKNSGRA